MDDRAPNDERDFGHLVGLHVVGWRGTELAIDQGGGGTQVRFLVDPPFQFLDLQAEFANRLVARFFSRLDEDCNYFGLRVDSREVLLMNSPEATDVLRLRPIDLPTGAILAAEPVVDEFDEVVEVLLKLTHGHISIRSGEVVRLDDRMAVKSPGEFLVVQSVDPNVSQ